MLKIPDFSAPFTNSIIPMMTPRISMSMKSRNLLGGTAPIINVAPAAKSAVYALSILSVAIRTVVMRKIVNEMIFKHYSA